MQAHGIAGPTILSDFPQEELKWNGRRDIYAASFTLQGGHGVRPFRSGRPEYSNNGITIQGWVSEA